MKDYIKQMNALKGKKHQNLNKISKFQFETELEKGIKHLSKNDEILRNVIKLVGTCRLKPHKKVF